MKLRGGPVLTVATGSVPAVARQRLEDQKPGKNNSPEKTHHIRPTHAHSSTYDRSGPSHVKLVFWSADNRNFITS